MAQVIKVKYNDTLRRVTVPEWEHISFASLTKTIADLFNLSSDAFLAITYTDKENDVVTMVNQADLEDAILLQRLNPLKLHVSVTSSPQTTSVLSSVASDALSVSGSSAAEVPSVQQEAAPAPSGAEGSTMAPSGGTNKEAKEEAKEEGGMGVKVNKASAVKEVEGALRRAFEELVAETLEAGGTMDSLEPVLAQVPKIVDLIEAFGRVGIAASFEPTFRDAVSKTPCGESLSSSDSSSSTSPVGATASAGSALASKQEGEKQADNGLSDNAGAASDVQGRSVHMGVQCDGCDVFPITGMRYRSLLKTDYDLCADCYAKTGVEAEYSKVERPLRLPKPCHAYRPAVDRLRMTPPFFGGRPFHAGGRGAQSYRSVGARFPADGKLDCRFVKDVTVGDGTELPPGARFTKTWRLRNSGSAPWPAHTRLVSVGGDRMQVDDFVPVQVPDAGLLPGEEAEVSVALVAPPELGRHTSHWRLMAPGGRKFGDRMWAVIQVVPLGGPQVGSDSASHSKDAKTASVPVSSSPSSAVQPLQSMDALGAEKPDVVISTPSVKDQRLAASSAPATMVDGAAHTSRAESASAKVCNLAPIVVTRPVDESVKTGGLSAVPARSFNLPADMPIACKKVPETDSPKMEETSVGGFSLVEHPVRGEASLAIPAPAGRKEQQGRSPSRTSVAALELAAPVVATLNGIAPPASAPGGTVNVGEAPSLVPAGALNNAAVDAAPVQGLAPGILFMPPPPPPTADAEREEVLEQLNAMGFADRGLNAALLSDFGMDLQKTLDALVAVAEWDPLVYELAEMGFSDASLNRQLLLKNNGSVRNVVKALVKQYKAGRGGK